MLAVWSHTWLMASTRSPHPTPTETISVRLICDRYNEPMGDKHTLGGLVVFGLGLPTLAGRTLWIPARSAICWSRTEFGGLVQGGDGWRLLISSSLDQAGLTPVSAG